MIKVIILTLIVLALTTACGGLAGDQIPTPSPTSTEGLDNLVFLGEISGTGVQVYRFTDNDTPCWVAVRPYYTSSPPAIYCQ